MIGVDVKVNKAQMADLERTLKGIPRGVPRVLTRAINRVGVAARRQVVKAVSREIAVTQKDLKARNVRLRKANFRTLRARISISGRRIPVLKFGAKQTRRGVTYRIKRGGGRKRIADAFMEAKSGTEIRMPSGHRGVFRRRMGSRLPIDELFGPSVPAVVEGVAELAAETMNRQLGRDLDKEVTKQVGWLLERRRAS